MVLSTFNAAEPVALRNLMADIAVTSAESRDGMLDALRRTLLRIQAYVREAFEDGRQTGLEAARTLATLTDNLLIALLAHASVAAPPAASLCVIATGGYGRGVLAPFSDIDLLFLTQGAPEPDDEAHVSYVLYLLWDLGLKVGHATRSTAECRGFAASDVTICTSLIDARLIAGDLEAFAAFRQSFWAEMRARGPSAFIAAKQSERVQRHHRYGDSPYLVEPNIKEGRGALRDLQTLGWMLGATLPERLLQLGGAFPETLDIDVDGRTWPLLTRAELRHGRRAYGFLWTIRFHLHLITGRAEERLTFDMQPVVGARMGYTKHGRQEGVERFMRHYFLIARDVIRLTAVLEPALLRIASGPPALAPGPDASLERAGLTLADGKLMPADAHGFEAEPIQMLRILLAARDRHLPLHPLAVRSFIRNDRGAAALRDDPLAAAMFLDLLCGTLPPDPDGVARTDGATWLGLLNETGFLSRFLPDWARIVGQMQFDTYHIFTVDEHTVETIRVLNALEAGLLAEVAPVASGLLPQVQSRRALYVALVLHDIAKGRGGDHSELGAELAMTIGPALGLSAEETDTVSWLVLHHLLLSQTAFKRDIDDPKTIVDIADIIQSPERLRLLLVLTVADMRAVSPRVWNGWKATLLRELYARVAEVLEGGLSVPARDQRVQRAKDAVRSLLEDWTEPDRLRFFGLGYPGYWLSFDPQTHARHGRIIRDADGRGAPLTVDLQVLPARSVTEVTIYTADHVGLFSRIAGALAIANASIVDARIHTLTNGSALDTFWIQDAGGGAFDAPHRLARLSVLIEQALSGRLRISQELARATPTPIGRRMRAINVPPRVVIDNHASRAHTVLEVNGRDRPGLLHDVTHAISEAGLQIASAHVTTYGVRAVDVFYVKDVFGLKVENERKLGQLREALLAALAGGEVAARVVA